MIAAIPLVLAFMVGWGARGFLDQLIGRLMIKLIVSGIGVVKMQEIFDTGVDRAAEKLRK